MIRPIGFYFRACNFRNSVFNACLADFRQKFKLKQLYSAFFLTLAIGIYMTKTLDRVNKLFSRNF
jgi:hypothetical protein